MQSKFNLRRLIGGWGATVVYSLKALVLASVLLGSSTSALASSTSHWLEALTWTEVRDRVAAGSTTILVPIGGTEQSGPHLVLGKHNVRARVLADEIAKRLGNALVAPVIAYVPEGAITPPAAHMRFAGTISISDAAFESMLESTARSFKQHGFRDVVFLGDHGGYQKNEERVAQRLNREWAKDPSCRVHALLDYYRVTQTTYVAALRAQGFTDNEIGQHAGLADTSLALAVDPALVRKDLMVAATTSDKALGVSGDPRQSTAELGQIGIQKIIQTSVAAIQGLTRQPRHSEK
ncbi:MAG: creatininase family protein [Rhodoferax sp.]|nr:creatininase family protein [Rhodoferax sp.]